MHNIRGFTMKTFFAKCSNQIAPLTAATCIGAKREAMSNFANQHADIVVLDGNFQPVAKLPFQNCGDGGFFSKWVKC